MAITTKHWTAGKLAKLLNAIRAMTKSGMADVELDDYSLGMRVRYANPVTGDPDWTIVPFHAGEWAAVRQDELPYTLRLRILDQVRTNMITFLMTDGGLSEKEANEAIMPLSTALNLL